MKQINVHTCRGQRPRGIRTDNTTGIGGTGLGGIVWRVPTILMVLLLGILLIACQEAKPSSDSKPTLETTTNANVITAKWKASEEASGYIITVTDNKGAIVFSKTVASETDKKEYELDIPLSGGKYTVIVFTKEKPDEAIATKAIAISTEATPPGKIQDVKATKGKADGTDSVNSITLTWTKLTNTNTGKTHKGETAELVQYSIYWKEGDSIPTDLSSIPSSNIVTLDKPTAKDATTFTHTFSNFNKKTQYAFAIRATNNAGLESDVSDTANATTDDADPKLKELWAYEATVTAVFDAALKAVDSKKFTVTQGSTTYKVNSAVLATDRVNLTLDKTLQTGEEITVAITAGAVTSSSDRKNKADSNTVIVRGAVYKPHSSTTTTHKGKFSLGDYNDPGLFKIVGLTGGSQPQYKITVATVSAITPIYTLAKQQIAEKVPSSGTDKGSIYVGLAMDR